MAAGLAGIAAVFGFAAWVLLSGEPVEFTGYWALPIGSFSVRVGLSEALMLLFVNLFGCMIAISLRNEVSDLDIGALLACVPAMGLCVAARDVVAFLMAWEAMALCGVVWQRGRSTPDDRMDGYGLWAYLASVHFSTACLMVAVPMIAIMGGAELKQGQPLLWDGPLGTNVGPGMTLVLVMLVLAGFGTKAAVFPFHPWLRAVYRNAPAHFGAISSGLMAKVSLFLLIRTLIRMIPMIGSARMPWLAGSLMIIGMMTGLAGLGGTLTTARIKVLLGYSSMENVGVMLIGTGLGFWGVTRGAWTVAFFAFAGVWFHVLNHMVAKICLFLATHNIVNQTSTDDIARLGGLHRRMPLTANAFGAGALALSAMVPLNAFESELLIYAGLFRGVLTLGPVGRDLSILAAAVLGLMGGLAAVCFTGTWGLGFLGNPRTAAADGASEAGLSVSNRTVLKSLAFAMILLGVAPVLGLTIVRGAVTETMLALGCPETELRIANADARGLLLWMSVVASILFASVFLLKRWRDSRLMKTHADAGLTWDCGFGYVDSFPRGQYGPVSYFDPLGDFVSKWTWQKVHRPEIREPFPESHCVRIESADGALFHVYDPIYRFVGKQVSKFRWIQAGSIQLYLAMLVVTLVGMLIWMMSV